MDHHTHYLSPPGHGQMLQKLCTQFQRPQTMEFQASSNGSLSLTKTNTRWLMPHTFIQLEKAITSMVGEKIQTKGQFMNHIAVTHDTTHDMGSDHSPQALNAQFLGSSLKRVPSRSNNGGVTLLWTWRAIRLSKERKSCNWRMPHGQKPRVKRCRKPWDYLGSEKFSFRLMGTS